MLKKLSRVGQLFFCPTTATWLFDFFIAEFEIHVVIYLRVTPNCSTKHF